MGPAEFARIVHKYVCWFFFCMWFLWSSIFVMFLNMLCPFDLSTLELALFVFYYYIIYTYIIHTRCVIVIGITAVIILIFVDMCHGPVLYNGIASTWHRITWKLKYQDFSDLLIGKLLCFSHIFSFSYLYVQKYKSF